MFFRYFYWSIRILLVPPRFCWFRLFTLWMFLSRLLNVAFTVYLKQSETRRPNTSAVCMHSVLTGFGSDWSRNSSVAAFTRLHNTQDQDLKPSRLVSLKVTSDGWCQTSVVERIRVQKLKYCTSLFYSTTVTVSLHRKQKSLQSRFCDDSLEKIGWNDEWIINEWTENCFLSQWNIWWFNCQKLNQLLNKW